MQPSQAAHCWSVPTRFLSAGVCPTTYPLAVTDVTELSHAIVTLTFVGAKAWGIVGNDLTSYEDGRGES